jgi:heme exporter protein B
MENSLIHQVKVLFLKELKLEWRQRYAINGILLQLSTAIFICYLSFRVIDSVTWNALFWLLLMFTSVNAIAKSFISERSGRLYYYHFTVHPLAVILSKLLLNIIISLILTALSLFFFKFLLGGPEINLLKFGSVAVLFSLGLSALFTLLSAISAKSGNGNLMMPVLSFPIVIPLFMVTLSASNRLLQNSDLFLKDLAILGLLDAMIILLSVVLFQYLWQE